MLRLPMQSLSSPTLSQTQASVNSRQQLYGIISAGEPDVGGPGAAHVGRPSLAEGELTKVDSWPDGSGEGRSICTAASSSGLQVLKLPRGVLLPCVLTDDITSSGAAEGLRLGPSRVGRWSHTARIGRMLEPKLRLLFALTLCLALLQWVLYFTGIDNAVNSLAQILNSLFLGLILVSLFLPMQHSVIRLLLVRPRVLYFIGASFLRSVLTILMVAAWWSRHAQLGSWIVQDVMVALAYVAVPLSDALPQRLRSRIVYIASVIIVIVCGGNFVHCTIDPVGCHAIYHDFNWTTHTDAQSLNQTINNTSPLEEHMIFSTLDLQKSCNFLLAVLAVEMSINNFKSPTTTNIIRDPISLEELHSAHTPSLGTVCSRLFGDEAGHRIDNLLIRSCSWLLAICLLCTLAKTLFICTESLSIETACWMPVSMIFVLSMETTVLKKLASTPEVLYFAISVAAGRMASAWIYIPRNPWPASLACMNEFTLGLALIVFLPLIDAIPPRFISQRFRVGAFALISINKSARVADSVACIHFCTHTHPRSLHLLRTPLLSMYLYIRRKLGIAKLHASGPVPELRVEGYVELSSLDILFKSYAVIALLSLHLAYQCLRFPKQAALIEELVPISKLHGPPHASIDAVKLTDDGDPAAAGDASC